MSKLTLKQKRFADEYIISGNATESAVKAGYSKKTARVIGQENLLKPAIKKYIEDRLDKIEEEKYLTIEEALKITTTIARGEPVKRGDALIYPTIKDSRDALDHFYKIKGLFTNNINMSSPMPIQVITDYGEEDED